MKDPGVLLGTVVALLSVGGLLAPSASAHEQAGHREAGKSECVKERGVFNPELFHRLKRLGLSAEQKEKVHQIAKRYDTRIAEVWKHEHALHMKLIGVEAWRLASAAEREQGEHKEHPEWYEGEHHAWERHQEGAEHLEGWEHPEEFEHPAGHERHELWHRESARRDEQRAEHEKGEHHEHGRELHAMAGGHFRALVPLWREMHELHRELVRLEVEKIHAIEKTLSPRQRERFREENGREEKPQGRHKGKEERKRETEHAGKKG